MYNTDGSMRGEVNSTCNPGERSIELPLWDEDKLQRLRERAPGLHHCVRGELCTHMCGSGSGVAVVRSAVDREAANTSRSVQCSEER